MPHDHAYRRVAVSVKNSQVSVDHSLTRSHTATVSSVCLSGEVSTIMNMPGGPLFCRHSLGSREWEKLEIGSLTFLPIVLPGSEATKARALYHLR
ncbi:hypothetical protein CfE428DRAFT_6495 [Chthoniobacter flavus Ellin428]|uniref:Uncharacterized protein n=1 Tax=Chthoniobacter flavus Ellin428 TaxID=497964 RepID=B4DC54_9BACT|nr:hypothetical protein CfE428DRAFT_6495 [Chthoniobacter flavus Ellin428]TCO83290.1 hypothetical protein EV701_14210 [Chthoniobacter flavus]